MTRSLRIIYAAGPGDIIGTFRHWSEGQDDPGQVALTYSAQFFDVCKAIGAKGLAISTHPRRERVIAGDFDLRHRAVPFVRKGGVLFHLGQVLHNLRLVLAAWWFRADVAVISGVTHWYVFLLLQLSRTRIVPALHCVLWRKFGRPSRVQRSIAQLDARLFRRADAILSASEDISVQVDQLIGQRHARLIEFLPTYRRSTFEAIPPITHAQRPFTVLYAGRIERAKGVFDLLEVARRCEERKPDTFRWHLCGTGSSLEQLRTAANEAGMGERFSLHGHVNRERMRSYFAEAHVVIVPTRSEFVEGFNQVVSESVLARRPCITSPVCPALSGLEEAAMVVPPDNVDAYVKAMMDLESDATLYSAKCDACAVLSERFFDESRGWAAALHELLRREDLTALSPHLEARSTS